MGRRLSMLLGAFLPTLAANAQPGLRGVDSLPAGGGNWNEATAISADGRFVVGRRSIPGHAEAFRWSTDGTNQLIFGFAGVQPRGISQDGDVIAGNIDAPASSPGGFVWTAGGGLIGIAPASTRVWAVSADGSSIVGESPLSHASWIEATRWTPVLSAIGLGDLPGGPQRSRALAVSADGSVIVGSSTWSPSPAGGYDKAFRWSEVHGMVRIDATGVGASTEATAVSGDGQVIAGVVYGGPEYVAFRWTEATGAIALPTAFGVSSPVPTAMSADGNTIVGTANNFEPFVWTASRGTRHLAEALVHEYGVDLGGWTLGPVTGISADGVVVVGNGYNPCGQSQGWIARLGPETFCYANCDDSTVAPVLNVNDFACFLNRFAAGDPRANCDGSCNEPVLNVNDFQCFLNRFAAGCP